MAIDEQTVVNEVSAIRRAIRRGRASWRIILLTVLAIAAVGLAAGVYFFQYRPDQETDAAAPAAKKAAEDGTVAVLSYSPENLDRDIAKAQSHLTGDFLSDYTEFTQQILASAAREKQVQTIATVVRAAVEPQSMTGDAAVVLVFVNKQQSSKESPDPQFTPATIRVTLTKVNGSWLIEQFEPL